MSQPDLTPDRAHRLCKMLIALGHGPLGKDVLVRKLKLEERGFFRDLRFIRELGINVATVERGYVLAGSLDDAFTRLPVPDLKISLRDALELSHGHTPVQRRVRRKLESIIGPISDLEPRSNRVMIDA
jgi:hypothetical protein